MKKLYTNLQTLALGLAAFGLSASVLADPITLQFEQVIDLDTGTVSDATLEAPEGADVRFAYHADRAEHAVVMPAGPGVEIAFVDDVVCANVIPVDVDYLAFSAEPVDQALSTDNCVVVRTDQGALYKLGNATESGMNVTVDCSAL